MALPVDPDKIDQAVLALLSLGRHEGNRTWKSFDWEVMGRLHQKGYISDPVGKAKSVVPGLMNLLMMGFLMVVLGHTVCAHAIRRTRNAVTGEYSQPSANYPVKE